MSHATSGMPASLRDLMARMGHDSQRAAMIYQHEARGVDQLITNAIDAHVRSAEQGLDGGSGQALTPAGLRRTRQPPEGPGRAL